MNCNCEVAGYMATQGLQYCGVQSDEYSMLTARNSLEAKDRVTDMPAMPFGKSALFCMADEWLVGAMPALCSRGMKVPDDMAVLAISKGLAPQYDLLIVGFMYHSGHDVGERAVRQIFEAM